MPLKYRLGLDMGATSIGWCVLRLDDNDQPCFVEDMGVRIFSDGRNAKDKKPLSVNRREKRSARRRRDRFVLRRRDLLESLIRHGLMPADSQERKRVAQWNPLAARTEAAAHPVNAYKLGRALFHINQRRGFKSNRIVDQQGDDKELTGMKEGIRQLRTVLRGRTLGQYLRDRQLNGEPVRMHPRPQTGNRQTWDFYADRQMYIDEFERIMAVQRNAHRQLADEVVDELQSIIFRQRPLRRPEPGWCALIHSERRMSAADPAFQRFRILQEVNNLEFENFGESIPPINQEDRQQLVEILTRTFSGVTKQGYLSWAKIGRALGFKGKVFFNLDKAGRKGLGCDVTSRKLSSEECFGNAWFELDSERQSAVTNKLLFEVDNNALKDWLQSEFSLSDERSRAIASVRLVKGYGRLSAKAVELLLPHLELGLTYDKACKEAGFNHSNRHTGELYDKGDLPYYGQVMEHHALGGDHELDPGESVEGYYGKINNPTVHIALNQLRQIVNALYKRYRNAPQEIHIELARELKLSTEKVKEIESTQQKNRELNEKIDQILAEHSVPVNYDNRMRYKLWEDLADEPDKRLCPFTGQSIPLSELFTDAYEVEHLLPFSRSFDDGRANKVICTRKANRDKGNRSPFEAFGNSPGNYDWKDILARVENMHKSKRWRFMPDAMERIQGDEESMIARLLTDTQYMSRVAREYMTYVLADHSRVVVSPGKLTAKLRHHWGLNSLLSVEDVKDRGDHRHHAIDALVMACTSRSTLQKVSTAAGKAEEIYLEDAIKDLPPPFPAFNREHAQNLVGGMVISHRPDNSIPTRAMTKNSTKDQLHEDTNWGLIGPSDRDGFSIFATRVPLASIDTKIKSVNEIANERIRNDLLAKLNETSNPNTKDWGAFLEKYGRTHNIRRVRIHREKSDGVMIPISDHEGRPYRYVQGGKNFCLDIWCTDKGKDAGKWQAHTVTMYEVHQDIDQPPWRKNNPTAWRVMRLHKNDMVAFDSADGVELTRVKKIDNLGRVYLRDHRIAKEQENQLSWAASAKMLQKKNARRVWVDPLGRVHDAGKARKVLQKN